MIPVAGALVTAALITSALLLTLVAPRLLATWSRPRRAPAPGLLLWQAVALSGVLCALLAAPVAALTLGLRHPTLLGMACAVSGVMLARVLWSGHRVGTDLRRRRAEHRALVDLVGERLESLRSQRRHDPVSVLAHPVPTAYCLPGRGDRIVLSRAAVDRLGREELRAVLAHEQAHLDHRHDLLLELFTALHEAVPAQVRAPSALREVHLLAEALADRRAARRTSAPALARALVAMATPAAAAPTTGTAPRQAVLEPALVAAGPGDAGAPGQQVRVRLGLLADRRTPAGLPGLLLAAAVLVLALPAALLLPLV